MLSRSDEAALKALAEEAGIATEQVDVLLLRHTVHEAPASWQPVLLAGRTATMAALTGHLLGADAAEILAKGAGRPVLFASKTQERWPGQSHVSGRLKLGRPLVLLATDHKIDAVASTELSMGGPFSLAVLVSDLVPPLDGGDRGILADMPKHAALLRIAFIHRPGISPSEGDLHDVEGMAHSIAGQYGFSGERFLGSAVVHLAKPGSAPQPDVNALMEYDPAAFRRHSGQPVARQVVALLDDIARAHPALDMKPAINLDEAERRRLCRETSSHVAALKRTLQKLLDNGEIRDSAALRSLAMTSVEHWFASAGLEASTFDYAEKAAPGLTANFCGMVQQELTVLEVRGGGDRAHTQSTDGGAGNCNPAFRLAIAVILGVLTLAVSRIITQLVLENWLSWLSSFALFALVTGAVFRIGSDELTRKLKAIMKTSPHEPPVITGYDEFKTRVSNGFYRMIAAPGTSARERIAALKSHLV